jgi:thiol-disulfide isomerase/thioredoxin
MLDIRELRFLTTEFGEREMKRKLTIVLGVTCATLIAIMATICYPTEVNRTSIVERQESRLALEDRGGDGHSQRLLGSQRLPKVPEYVDGKPAKYQDPITEGEATGEAEIGYPENYLLIWTADWCGYCKDMKVIAEELRAEGFDVYYIDFDENRDKARECSVTSLPTTIVYTEGTEAQRFIGIRKAEQIRGVLKKNEKEPGSHAIY